MSLVAKSEGSSNFIPVPTGMHLARCYRIIDLGTQKSEYMGNVKQLHKMMLQFEVHGEDAEGNPTVTVKGDPMTVSKNFTVTLAEKSTLRKDLQSWRGRDFTPEELRGFELKNVLGQWAMITVVETENNGNTYTNISNINPVPAVMKKNGLPEGKNELKIFSIDEPDMELFESFSDNLKNKIRQSPEWDRLYGSAEIASPAPAKNSAQPANFDDMADDLPF
jgi:nitrate reductase NapAB chaperone NapD